MIEAPSHKHTRPTLVGNEYIFDVLTRWQLWGFHGHV